MNYKFSQDKIEKETNKILFLGKIYNLFFCIAIVLFLFLLFSRPENKSLIYFFFCSIVSLTFYIFYSVRDRKLFVFENDKQYIEIKHLNIFRDLKEESKEKYIKTK